MTTQGNQLLNYNNHPFIGKAGLQQFALAHNGVISNDYLLHRNKEIPETTIETDSYAAVQLIEKEKHLSFESVKIMAETLKGSFVFTILDEEDSIYFVRGSNPLTIYNFYNDGFYLYASTKDILSNTMEKLGISKRPKYELEIKEGDILKINCFGEIERKTFDYDDWDNWYLRYCRLIKTTPVLDDLYDVAWSFGIDEACIDILYSNGYTSDEIEELLYDPDELICVLEILNYDYC
ncbi:MAG: glucosamine 6-phosphate synthetase [Ruminiclostridium sp.]|nr:glucosamine 6-phosphate synthetase [Ruminiclostridium sp.]